MPTVPYNAPGFCVIRTTDDPELGELWQVADAEPFATQAEAQAFRDDLASRVSSPLVRFSVHTINDEDTGA